ncbi:hypothetical protein ACE2AJ_16220 [Aquihabitans daechungensis]|uniref:hypothetical protein n=1 Tax=Aquihabitans daechungensis TaxID=1052257 RepID=UPI003BA33597
MSDAEPPAEVQGGPSWRRNAPASSPPPPPVSPSSDPATVAPPARPLGEREHTELEEDLYHPRYSRNSGTAIPYLVAAFVLMGAAWWAMRWSSFAVGAPDPVRSSEWWTSITGVLLPAEEIRLASYSYARMWIAVALLILAALAICLWIGRIGSNLRSNQQPFGSVLPLLAFPAWWILPLSIGVTTDSDRSREDLLVRFLLAFGILFAQFLLLRWPLLNRIWRAGHLPYDLASIVLWLPMMIPWMMFFLSNAFTLLAVGDDGDVSDSAWRPTLAMLDWARWTTRATGIATLVLLVVVTMTQHVGLMKDRAAADASRARARSERLPLLPPGA